MKRKGKKGSGVKVGDQQDKCFTIQAAGYEYAFVKHTVLERRCTGMPAQRQSYKRGDDFCLSVKINRVYTPVCSYKSAKLNKTLQVLS